MNIPERSPERDAAIQAMLPLVPDHGWSMATLRQALSETGGEPLDAEMFFPGGVSDLIETYTDLADRQMEQDAAEAGLADMRLPARVRAIVALRLERQTPNKEAIRRALAILAVPCNARVAARTLARTIDSMWHAAGDTSADFSWYTKRAILAGIYSSTLLYWLRDFGDDNTATLDFLDRRLAERARIGKFINRAEAFLARITPCKQAAEPAAS